MPSIASRLVNTAGPSPEFVQSPPSPTRSVGPTPAPASPVLSPILRCPLPTLVAPSIDNLRQYYAGGQIPQYRIPALPSLS